MAMLLQIMNTFIANGACSDDAELSSIWSFVPENNEPVVPGPQNGIRGLASGKGDLLAFMANLTQALSDLGIVLGESHSFKFFSNHPTVTLDRF